MIRVVISDDDGEEPTVYSTVAEVLRANDGSPDMVDALRSAWARREHRHGRTFASAMIGGGAAPAFLVTLHRFAR